MKEKHLFNLYNIKSSVFFILGLSMIALFVLIYIVAAVHGGGAGYAGFFYNNISENIGLTVMTALHTALLGFGILFLLIASYNISPKVKCYQDRLVVSHIFHNGHDIPYSEITAVEVKVVVLHRKRPWKKDEKEVRVTLKNPIYSFHFAYRTDGYFDDIENDRSNSENLRKIYVTREMMINIIEHIQKVNHLKMPYLPDEYNK